MRNCTADKSDKPVSCGQENGTGVGADRAVTALCSAIVLWSGVSVSGRCGCGPGTGHATAWSGIAETGVFVAVTGCDCGGDCLIVPCDAAIGCDAVFQIGHCDAATHFFVVCEIGLGICCGDEPSHASGACGPPNRSGGRSICHNWDRSGTEWQEERAD